ncbi:MAG: hypothetical protein QGH51_04260 [Planctomycetota bacterium]|jgi:hypothetical protein|nr:hypothetical protein [Planctomycetota bacterium]MDP6941223.1 hypothetical protein [Planctomycetota bacterium]
MLGVKSLRFATKLQQILTGALCIARLLLPLLFVFLKALNEAAVVFRAEQLYLCATFHAVACFHASQKANIVRAARAVFGFVGEMVVFHEGMELRSSED